MEAGNQPILCEQGNRCGKCPPQGDIAIRFCETITLHESFSVQGVTAQSACIAYDTDYIGYVIDRSTMNAQLPCGGTCPVNVYRINLIGAIPYIVSAGPVSSAQGVPVPVGAQGCAIVNQVVGYACGDAPEIPVIRYGDVSASVEVEPAPCGHANKTTLTFKGVFTISIPAECTQ